ncbi:hypothetical protein Q7C_2356 [Methylophaga frappieri]|uniref:Uncharacterized protein n=2 Tax=Methylophaga frappieri (strain ATCC BAA-2434 / DSM 25690 / JAM7) TaxID=754477 RepID=I1YKP7_METFJ|nr:hypothetical protein Q7C_2356 [Methylophaga frappieri]
MRVALCCDSPPVFSNKQADAGFIEQEASYQVLDSGFIQRILTGDGPG